MNKKKNIDRIIRDNIQVPQHLPLYMDKNSYINSAVNKVKYEMSRGKSLNEALYITNKNISPTRRGTNVNVPTMAMDKTKYAIIAVLAVAALLLAFLIPYFSSGINKVTGLSSVKDLANISEIDTDQMILATGVDTRPVVDEGSGTIEDIPGSRTDTITIIYLPKEANKLAIVSIPRDLSINMEKCPRWDSENNSYDNNDLLTLYDTKINSAYSLGGPECLLKTVNETFDLNIDKYAELDFGVFREVVDSIGGVKMNFEHPVIDDTLGAVIPEAGLVNLNGEQALNYVRARQVEGTSKSDLDRINRQQNFFISVFNSINAKEKSKDPLFLISMAKLLSDNMNTINLNASELASIMKSSTNVNPENFAITTIPIANENANGNLLFDVFRTTEMFNIIKSQDSLVDPESNQGDLFTGKPLGDVSITLLTKNPYDYRIKELGGAITPHVKEVLSTSAELENTQTIIFVNKNNYSALVSAAAMFPDALITTEPSPVNTHSDLIIALATDAEIVLKNMNIHLENKQYFVPFEFTGKGYQIIPKSLQNIVNP